MKQLLKMQTIKIEIICEQNLVIPEHIDITGEIDKLLQIIAEAEDKLFRNEEILWRKQGR